MIELHIQHDLDKVTRWAKAAAADQIPFVTARALTMTGQDIIAEEKKVMLAEFNRPTRWTLNALRLYPATKANLQATVALRDTGQGASRRYLQTQIEGGKRTEKRFERALQGAGLMPRGWVAVPGKRTSLDEFGNVPGKLMVQLLSYLGAFSEQGYRANMTDKRKASLAKRTKTEGGYAKIGGIEYFVSRGKGEYTGRGSWMHGRNQHLPPGIWARSGTHGSSTWPVFLFVPAAKYKPRFSFFTTAQRTADARFQLNWQRAWREAMITRTRLT